MLGWVTGMVDESLLHVGGCGDGDSDSGGVNDLKHLVV